MVAASSQFWSIKPDFWASCRLYWRRAAGGLVLLYNPCSLPINSCRKKFLETLEEELWSSFVWIQLHVAVNRHTQGTYMHCLSFRFSTTTASKTPSWIILRLVKPKSRKGWHWKFPRLLIAKNIRHAEQCQLRKCLLPECHPATLWLAAILIIYGWLIWEFLRLSFN